jgi:hypothetical protein
MCPSNTTAALAGGKRTYNNLYYSTLSSCSEWGMYQSDVKEKLTPIEIDARNPDDLPVSGV